MKRLLATAIILTALAPLAASADCGGKYKLDGADAVIATVQKVTPVRMEDGTGSIDQVWVQVTETLRGYPGDQMMLLARRPLAANQAAPPGLPADTRFIAFEPGQSVGLLLPRNDLAVADAYDLTYWRCNAGPMTPGQLRALVKNFYNAGLLMMISSAVGAVLGVVLTVYARRNRSKHRTAYIVGALTLVVVMLLLAAGTGLWWYGNSFS